MLHTVDSLAGDQSTNETSMETLSKYTIFHLETKHIMFIDVNSSQDTEEPHPKT